jgi:predicted DNA-binding protein (MmcQ/YjbR family)
MSTKRPDVPPKIVAKLRAICLALPEAREEKAWAGTRWRVGTKTFANVVMIADGWPPAYAKAAKNDGPICVLTFESPALAVDAETFTRPPFFRPPWRRTVVGLALGGRVDWEDVGKLIAASYCMLAPKKLSERVRRSH